MADLSNVEKILVDKHGFTDNGDGTVSHPNGSLYDTERGGYFTPEPAEKVVTSSNATTEDMQAIKELADLKYLAQNTGVATSVLNQAYAKLGIDPNDSTASYEADKLLGQFGYNPGDNKNYYGNNTAQDAGAQILYERWQQAPTAEDLEAAGMDPNTYQVVNSNAANALYLQQELSNRGINTSNTNASLAPTSAGRTINDVRQFWEGYGVEDEPNLDMFEWDLIKKKAEEKTKISSGGGTPAAGIVSGGAAVDSGSGGISGGFTASPDTLDIPQEAVMPGLRPSPISAGASETYTVPAQTFESNLKAQETDFQAREAEQAKMYQPQTLQEKQAAGQDVSSYAISQKLYRNPNTGQQIFVTFQGDQPLQPIPAGFYEVNQATGTFGQASGIFNPVTAGGNTFTPYTGAAQGGYIQGFSGEDGSYVAPSPAPIDPSQIYGDVSFTDPVTGQIVTQTPAEYFQSLANKQAQATFNPATSVSMSGVSTMAELGYEYNADGTIKIDPTTGQPVTRELMPGTVLESTAGQAQATAPVVTGEQIAQVSDVTQAKGPGTSAQYDAQGNLISAEVPVPGAATAALTTAAPSVAQQLQGGTTTNYQGMAAAVPGATWDVGTGTFTLNGIQYTPDQFVQANNLNVGDFMTTTGGLQAVTSTGPTKTIDAAQQTTTGVSGLTAETGSATDVTGAPTRTLQTGPNGELITGTGVDQAAVGQAFGTGEVQAASVQDELAGLMAQFEDGDTPAWAAGSMRRASQMLAARGLGASSMAGQAVIQAAMEAALPIAQIDAGNKQQMALFKAEQRAKFLGMEFDQAFQAKVQNAARVSEIANMNFSAEQQIALENSRAANTMNLQNLTNKQALVMAEAAALSQLDMANLNNLQQAAVQNAQNFLQIDMANLSNSQSTALFKAQQVSNAMLSDAAQANATAQFNATSENQTTQFMSNLAAQVSQFNAAQQNAINQFNAEEANALLEFNSALQNQREMFNAQNYLVVAQANAQWRQNINTANTEAQNVANLTYAKEVNGLTQKALDDYWQKERDIMSYAFAQSENTADRALKLLLGNMDMEALRAKIEYADNSAKAEFWSDLLFGDMSFSDIFKTTEEE
jgi:hypothetical protein